MDLWTRLHHLEPGWTGLFFLTAGFVVALFLRRWLPEHRRHRGRTSVLLLGLGPVLHLLATGIGLLGLASVSATLHLLNVFVVLLGITGVSSLVVFDIVLGRTALPTITRDLLQTAVFFALSFGVLRSGGLDPLSVVTTSAVVTAILGLALQSVIANTFAGLVLQIERSIALGDWIEVGDRIGRIEEIRWRSSTLVTREGDVALVPNLQLLSQEVVNLSRPTRSRRVVVKVPFHNRHSPGEVREALLAAMTGSPGVLAEPAPSCLPIDFAGATIVYAASCWVADLPAEPAVEGSVRERIWYAAERAGLEGPCPAAPSVPDADSTGTAPQRAELARRLRAVDRVAIFAPLDPEERVGVARAMARRRFAAGEVILRQGDAGDSLFVVDQGEVAVDVDGGPAVARLGPGQFFGEMSLLTGEARRATVVANRETLCDEIGSESLMTLLASRPELAGELARLLAVRQTALAEARQELSAHSRAVAVEQVGETLFRRVREYFHLG